MAMGGGGGSNVDRSVHSAQILRAGKCASAVAASVNRQPGH